MTLTENSVITNPYYLFEAFDKASNSSTFMILGEDLSTDTDRCNRFEITETDNPVAEGEIELNVGQYVYRVYEQDNDSNLDPDGLNKVEEGGLVVTTTITDTSYNGDTTNTTYEA